MDMGWRTGMVGQLWTFHDGVDERMQGGCTEGLASLTCTVIRAHGKREELGSAERRRGRACVDTQQRTCSTLNHDHVTITMATTTPRPVRAASIHSVKTGRAVAATEFGGEHLRKGREGRHGQQRTAEDGRRMAEMGRKENWDRQELAGSLPSSRSIPSSMAAAADMKAATSKTNQRQRRREFAARSIAAQNDGDSTTEGAILAHAAGCTSSTLAPSNEHGNACEEDGETRVGRMMAPQLDAYDDDEKR
ncbi:hypothetical protein SCHPADRAFT_263986 [Schizopora paradoxa]|uniref:Uncharacterized protein n=1 Tax=Schizopora paradoxa TaxID=27342 RepID=A0A0H2S173_9AGAM|nr:hypothetical protein SCHPADRAFT_263986 [Schizopora paradoxa]